MDEQPQKGADQIDDHHETPETTQSLPSTKPESELVVSETPPQPPSELPSSDSYMDIKQYSQSVVRNEENERETLASDEKNREQPKMNAEEVTMNVSEHDLNIRKVEDVKTGETPTGSNEQMKDVKEVVQTQERSDLDSQHKKIAALSDAHSESILSDALLESKIGDDILKSGDRITELQMSKLPMNIVLTLAGDNKGASMETSNSSHGEAARRKDHPTEAYANNNAQGVNNSILLNVLIAERNPGVRVSITQELVPSAHDDKHFSPVSKVGIRVGIEKPVVRRRCLRGLFLESSDSDGTTPAKPRRHGCRAACKHGRKGKRRLA